MIRSKEAFVQLAALLIFGSVAVSFATSSVKPEIEVVFTIGSQKDQTYTERTRFVLRVSSKDPIERMLPAIREKYIETGGKAEYADYIYLTKQNGDEILDTKKSFDDYGFIDGSTIRVFVNIR